jgi:hypothetical protein
MKSHFASSAPAWAAALLTLGPLAALAQPPAPSGTWEQIVPQGAVTGADGRSHLARCTGLPGTDPTFSFWAKRTPSKNLVVYFEGGGACWDSLTCSFPIGGGLPAPAPQFYVAAIPPGTQPAAYDGIFRDDPANPVAGWNAVYIPYCSADIHTGSSTQTYANAGNPLLPPTFTLEHRGFDNFMVVLDWMSRNIDRPADILVAGSSAGGYGATANFPWIAQAFRNAHVSVLADASQGVTTPAFDTGLPGRESWNPQLKAEVFGPDATLVPGPELMRRAALASPKVKTAQFTTRFDEVQIGFYGVMKQFYGPGGSCPHPALDWNALMVGQLASDLQAVPNLRSYVAAGSYHTVMRSPLFYSESSAGLPFSSWLGAMLKNRGGTGASGGGWESAACPGCLAALPCF